MMSSARFDILIVIPTLELGGAEHHVCQMSSSLQTSGWRVAVLPLLRGGPLIRQLEASGVPVLGLTSARFERVGRLRAVCDLLGNLAMLFWILAARRVRILHCFLPHAYLAAGLMAVLTGFGNRVMSRRSRNLYHADHRVLAWIERHLHARFPRICGNSKAVLDDLRAEGVEEHKLRLIYNGFDEGRLPVANPRARIRADLGIPQDRVVLIIVANLFAYKGHADLFQALHQLAAAGLRNWTLLVVGRDAGALADLRALAEKLNLEDDILFLGPRDDVLEVLLSADVALLVSHQEGFSNAILEAMACALPVIATDVGGNAEAVLDGQTGLICLPKDPQALAAAIAQLLNNPNACREMGAQGRARIRDHFSLKQMMKGYEKLFNELLS